MTLAEAEKFIKTHRCECGSKKLGWKSYQVFEFKGQDAIMTEQVFYPCCLINPNHSMFVRSKKND